MRYIDVSASDGKLHVPEIALGCMRVSKMGEAALRAHIDNALAAGVNFFDHADIYGGGESEALFGRAIAGVPRASYILQSKCGIRNGMYDFSKEHILASVDASLSRLRTDYLDVLLLHRPDALCEPEEVAEAFSALKQSGKVRYFGVSNHNPYQIALLQKYWNEKLIFNQLQFSIMHASSVSSGIHVNMQTPDAVDRDRGILDYCRLSDITVQAWSPLMYGFFEGNFVGNEKFPALNQKLAELAEKYGAEPSAIAIAWILRHPAHIQAVVGTTDPEHLRALCRASEIGLSREEWYGLFRSAGNELP